MDTPIKDLARNCCSSTCVFCILFFKKRLTYRHTFVLILIFFGVTLYNLTTEKGNENRDQFPIEIKKEIISSELHDTNAKSNNNQYDQKCTSKYNLVYIKTIKCASETLVSIFRRYGYIRNLSFALPPGDKIYLGWPYELQKGYYREPKVKHFNILCEHVVFNKKFIKSLMAANTVYITSIRHPYSQFKSMFHYYNLAELIGITDVKQPLHEYLLNLQKYENIYKSEKVSPKRYCVPNNFSMSQNPMSYTLGWDSYSKGKHINQSFISSWLSEMDNDFKVVIIVEYFVESLIIMRRSLCWTWKDILYIPQNYANYNYKYETDPQLEAIYKSWSKVDYALYNFFNQTLWNKINEQSNDFFEEVFKFKKTRLQVEKFCDTVLKKRNKKKLHMLIKQNKWSPAFLVKWSDCDALTNSADLLVELKRNYDKNPVKVNQPPAPKFVC